MHERLHILYILNENALYICTLIDAEPKERERERLIETYIFNMAVKDVKKKKNNIQYIRMSSASF